MRGRRGRTLGHFEGGLRTAGGISYLAVVSAAGTTAGALGPATRQTPRRTVQLLDMPAFISSFSTEAPIHR